MQPSGVRRLPHILSTPHPRHCRLHPHLLPVCSFPLSSSLCYHGLPASFHFLLLENDGDCLGDACRLNPTAFCVLLVLRREKKVRAPCFLQIWIDSYRSLLQSFTWCQARHHLRQLQLQLHQHPRLCQRNRKVMPASNPWSPYHTH